MVSPETTTIITWMAVKWAPATSKLIFGSRAGNVR